MTTAEIIERENEHLDVLCAILTALKIDDVMLSFDASGTLIAEDTWDNKWVGKEFYLFLINEAFVYQEDGSVLGISNELYSRFKALAEEMCK